MEAKMYNTKTFNDVFPHWEAFITWFKSLNVGEILEPRKLTFLLIQAEYRGSHLAMEEQCFKDHFFIDLYTYVKEFEQTSDAIDALMALTDEQIAQSGSMITNVADIPERESSTNIEEVDFVSQQQKVINKKGALQIKREQISSKRAYTTKTFLKRFRHLFVKILSTAYTPVIQEREGD